METTGKRGREIRGKLVDQRKWLAQERQRFFTFCWLSALKLLMMTTKSISNDWSKKRTFIDFQFSSIFQEFSSIRKVKSTNSDEKTLFHFQSKPNVYLSHEVFEKGNAWAITPILIDILNQLIKPQTRWFVLCEANSMVNFQKLLSSLSIEDHTVVSDATLNT